MKTHAATREPAMKKRPQSGFGKRLAELRRSRGMTQIELGQSVGVSNRVIHYYEHQTTQPPGAILGPLAQALGVTVDQLLGLKPSEEPKDRRTARLLRRLERITELSPQDQAAVLKFLDALLETRGQTSKEPATKKRKSKTGAPS